MTCLPSPRLALRAVGLTAAALLTLPLAATPASADAAGSAFAAGSSVAAPVTSPLAVPDGADPATPTVLVETDAAWTAAPAGQQPAAVDPAVAPTLDPIVAAESPDLVAGIRAPVTVQAGDAVTATITIANSGTAQAPAGVVLEPVLPAGVTVRSAGVLDGFACVLSDLSCTSTAPLPAGGPVLTLVVELAFDPALSGAVPLSVSVSPAGGEPADALADNTATTTITVLAGPELEDRAPADLAVTLSGPVTGTAGGTGTWSVGLENLGTVDAAGVRLALELPDTVEVVSVAAADGWTCVLAPVSCQLEGGLAAGRTASPIELVLAYDEAAVGPQPLAVLAYQGEGPGQALRIDRGEATVLLSAPPVQEPPVQEPPLQEPPAPVTPVGTPQGTAVSTVAGPAPRTAGTTSAGSTAAGSSAAGSSAAGSTAAGDVTELPATSPGAELAAPAQPDPAAGPSAQSAPETLPFAEEEPAAPAQAQPSTPAPADNGSLVLLLVLIVAATLVAGGVALRGLAQRRSA